MSGQGNLQPNSNGVPDSPLVSHSNSLSYSNNMENMEQMMTDRERTHRQHYSRVKSAAITASYRLMQAAPHDILVRKTANAAINGMRPEFVKSLAKHSPNLITDVVEDSFYNHFKQTRPITSICLISEPRRRNQVNILFIFL